VSLRRRLLPRLLWLVVLTCGGTFSAAAAATAQAPPPTEAADINDASTTRRVQLLTAGLALAGVTLAGVTFWFWRNTRPDPDALAPLDVMSQNRWRRQDVEERDRALALLRVSSSDAKASPEAVDLAALAAARSLPKMDDHAGFGDLVEASLPAESAAADVPARPTILTAAPSWPPASIGSTSALPPPPPVNLAVNATMPPPPPPPPIPPRDS
jgi:hypothetical protein